MTQFAKHLILCILPNGTGIQQNDIRNFTIFGRPVTHKLQQTFDRFGVMLVHLATKCIYDIMLAVTDPLQLVGNRVLVQDLYVFFPPLLLHAMVRFGQNLNIPASDSDFLPVFILRNDPGVREVKIFGIIFRFLSHVARSLLYLIYLRSLWASS
ncbi:hypothetical protein D3C81_1197290 [compost metagenome]